MKWKYTVRVKHLFTSEEDHESVQQSMNDIADVLEKEVCFKGFSFKKFRNIPKGGYYFGPVDYANKLLSKLYNYADANRIWIA